jgi:hypothetical protein
VAARDRHFDRALNVALAFNVGEIDLVVLVAGEELAQVAPDRLELFFSPDELESLAQIPHSVDVDPRDHGGFLRVCLRHHDRALSAPPRFERYRQNALDRPDRAVERQLADKAQLGEQIFLDLLRGRDHAERDREIEARAFLLNVGRSEIDRCAPARPIVTAVADRGRDAILAFLHRRVGQAHDHDFGVAAGGVDLDLDFVSVHAVNGRGINPGEHGFERVRRSGRSPSCAAKICGSGRELGARVAGNLLFWAQE